MPWSLAGITIHVEDSQDVEVVEANYAIQEILDATSNTITFFGANSNRRTLDFVLNLSTSGSGALNTLKTAVRTDANVNLTSDQGSQGNYRILSFRATRVQALNIALPVYRCAAELIQS